MQKEKLNKQNKPGKEGKEGYIIVPNYFLKKWVKVLGVGPALLYLQLLSYCHKGKDIAWPTLTTLSSKLGISKNSLLSYRKILLKYGLIKKIIKRRTAQGNYQSNFYKVTPLGGGANIELRQVQILGEGGANIAPGVVQNLHPNNSNLKHYQGSNNKKIENAAVVAVNFKKLKKKGDLSAYLPERVCSQTGNAQSEEKMQAVREQLMDLDFEESFIKKLLKDYSLKKIEEKIDLLLNKRNIQNPAGWLMAALKNDYPTPHPHLDPPPSRGRKLRESVKINSGQLRIDSRFRGNDIKGSGYGIKESKNEIKESKNEIKGSKNEIKESGYEISRGVWPYAPPSNIPANSDLSGRGNLKCTMHRALNQAEQIDNRKILSTEEARRRFRLLRQRLMAMNSP